MTPQRPSDRWREWRPDDVPAISGRLAQAALALLAVEAVIAVVLRFSTTSLLWLDEALTVNIAKLPLNQLHAALKRDGAPPLYYAILHVWMQLFGSGDFAVRSLSGLFSVVTLVVVYFVVRRIWGSEVGIVSTAILGASSFATYYATEVRMYALVMLLVALGMAALMWLFERPNIARAALVALVAIALEYTHYWSLYLLAVIGIWLLAAAIASRDQITRRASRLGIGALVVAAVAFVPWLPTFLYQSKHTGTPWALAPSFFVSYTALLHFDDNQAAHLVISSYHSRILQVIVVVLLTLGVFGAALAASRIQIEMRTLRRGRLLGFVVLGTLMMGIVGAHFSGSAYAARYGSVIYVPLVVLLAVGVRSFKLPWARAGLVLVVVLSMLLTAVHERTTQRTQARQIAAVLNTQAKAGDLVVFCPDQLGPSVTRVVQRNDLRMAAYPRFNNPNIINWVDYKKALGATNPSAFAQHIKRDADRHSVWLVWSIGYGGYKLRCGHLASDLLHMPGWGGHQWVNAKINGFYQSMNLTQFNPADYKGS